MVSFQDQLPHHCKSGVTGNTVRVEDGCEGTEKPGSREGMPAILGSLLTGSFSSMFPAYEMVVSTFRSLPISQLILSGNTLTDVPRNKLYY